MDKYEYKHKVAKEKKDYAREVMELPLAKDVKQKDREEWQRKHILYLEICEQIVICEELVRPLTKEMIKELCGLKTVREIRNYCRKVKIA